MQCTYLDISFSAQNSFWTRRFWFLLALPLSFVLLLHMASESIKLLNCGYNSIIYYVYRYLKRKTRRNLYRTINSHVLWCLDYAWFLFSEMFLPRVRIALTVIRKQKLSSLYKEVSGIMATVELITQENAGKSQVSHSKSLTRASYTLASLWIQERKKKTDMETSFYHQP